MVPEKLVEVLGHEGVVSIVTQGVEVHIINTWNSYLHMTEDDCILILAGDMSVTEANIKVNPNVMITLGSREVMGKHSMGTGFLIKGVCEYLYSGTDFDFMKERFPWIRTVIKVSELNIKQTL